MKAQLISKAMELYTELDNADRDRAIHIRFQLIKLNRTIDNLK